MPTRPMKIQISNQAPTEPKLVIKKSNESVVDEIQHLSLASYMSATKLEYYQGKKNVKEPKGTKLVQLGQMHIF